MNTDSSSQLLAALPSTVTHQDLPRFGDASRSGEVIAELDDHRHRRGGSYLHAATDFGGDSANPVTVLVISVAGSADQRWLREFAEAHLLASTEFPFLERLGSRSQEAGRPAAAGPNPVSHLTGGQLRMDLDEMRVTLAERPITLTRQEFLLLKVFMQNPFRLLSRKQLLEQAWGNGEWTQSRTIDVHVRRIRAKLGAQAPQIATVRGFGYRFEPGPAELVR